MSSLVAWGLFLVSAAAVLLASQWLARSGDALARRTGMSGTFVGVLLLAIATSLPEIATGAGALTIADSVDLAAGGIFGSNVFNLAVIAMMELLAPRSALLSTIDRSMVTLAVGSGLLILVAAMFVAFLDNGDSQTGGPVHYSTAVLLVGYLAILYREFRTERIGPADRSDGDEIGPDVPSIRMATAMYLIAAAVVFVGGFGLAESGDRIADEMGWNTSFVGTLFLAASTSLPEMATSVGLIRLGSADVAVGNMIGSNLFNTGLIPFVFDLIHMDGFFLQEASSVHLWTMAISLVMTAAVVTALVVRPRGKLVWRLSPEAVLLAGLFLGSHFLTFLRG